MSMVRAWESRRVRAVDERYWRLVVGALVVVRVAVPLLALAASGRELPGLPAYTFHPLTGDSYGYYAAARGLISSAVRIDEQAFVFVGAIVVLALAGAVLIYRRSERDGWLWIPFVCLVVSSLAAVAVAEMANPGSPTIGWPLIWAVPLAPLRVAGLLHRDSAFALGLVLSLVANAVTVAAGAVMGRRATGSRAIGIATAALLAFWPLFVRPLAGPEAWFNSQWLVDVGLALYSEPLSTALVAVATAIVLDSRASQRRYALAGALLGFATTVRLSNAVIAAVFVVVVLMRDRRRVVALVVGGLAWLPVVIAFWPKSYYIDQSQVESGVPATAWGFRYAVESWANSSIFGPRTLVIIVPLLILGAVVLRHSRAAPLLVGPILATALLYTPYRDTDGHPRFLYVILPHAFVLVATGIVLIGRFMQDFGSRWGVRSP